ncbi:MAG: NYN domain-containing protein [Deltaproteobacteria bacterium]|nr:NYN domain-containing protein [Deltaproteobacteria bacterium]
MLEERNIALFCDFENIAIGVNDAKFDPFDIQLILGRILDKGKIVVKKAYADWERYKAHKRAMHEAAFELIEIPHVSYSGKNSADIRLVVDALDLCYTKSHVDTFVILSGDSDFSPLVSKLRENNKQVIGLGVKNSTSDLLIDNCDEFIYYDDLVRKKAGSKRKSKSQKTSSKASASKATTTKSRSKSQKASEEEEEAKAPKKGLERPGSLKEKDLTERRDQAIEHVLDTVEALFAEREGNLWGSMVKQTLKRKRPNFDETFHGYSTFNQLLEDAQRQGLLVIQRDEKSGGYQIHAFGPKA